MKYCFLGFLALLFISCKGNKQQLAALLKEWEQKEIIFPSHTVFTIQGKDTVDFCIKDQYKVLVYTDSTGCTGCRLRLADWKKCNRLIQLVLIPFSSFFSSFRRKVWSSTIL